MSRRQPRPNSHVNSSSRKIVQKAARKAAPASASNRQSNQVVATMARGAIAACTKSHDRAPTLSEMAALAAAFETNPSVRAAAQKDDGKKRRKAHKKRKAKILKEMQDRQHHHQQRYSMVNTYLLARVSLMAAKTRNHLMSLQTVNVASKSKRRSQRRLLVCMQRMCQDRMCVRLSWDAFWRRSATAFGNGLGVGSGCHYVRGGSLRHRFFNSER